MASSVLESKHTDLREVFSLLESKEIQVVDSVKNLIQENLSSIKESWLVNSLVDFYFSTQSKAARDILCHVSGSHEKPLLEKVCEGIRSQEHVSSALQLLLHIVCKHPIWMSHLVTNVPVFKTVIKCLKVETNIPVLMTAVTIVTILLPSIPVLVGPYLPDIFEIFIRLASFGVKRPAINAPDIFFLHLQVAVYALFHRLYGMFPYNFLTYLRHYYTKKENVVVFDEVIKCMLERVRVHPLLITGTKESETSGARWRQMETNDVVVQCSSMTLDPVEGTWEELHCPIVASRFRHKTVTTSKDTSRSFLASVQAWPEGVTTSQECATGSAGPLDFTSPSEIMGLSTPPPTRRETPAVLGQLDLPSTTPHLHPTPTVVTVLTPMNTPRETPPVTEDHDKGSSKTSRSHSNQKPDAKRLSTEFPSNPVVPLLTPSSNMQSVPPSPLKTEFTSTPPLGVKTLPVINAARELQFDTDKSEFPLKSIDKIIADRKATVAMEMVSKEGSPCIERSGEQSKSTTPKWPSRSGSVTQFEDSLDLSGKVPYDTNQAASGAGMDDLLSSSLTVTEPDAVSLDSLQQVVQKLDINNEDNDDEVSELTAGSSSHESNGTLTAESVAKLMRTVNRIRFNSLTATNMEQIKARFGPSSRSRSCPQFPGIDSMEEEEDCEDGLMTELTPKSLPDSISFDGSAVVNEKRSASSMSEVAGNLTQTGACACPVTQSTTVTISSTVETTITSQTLAGASVKKCPLFDRSSETPDRQTEEKESDFMVVLKHLFNPGQTGVCMKCSGQMETPEANAKLGFTPFFSTLSPPDLLDKHIQQARDIHTKELSKLPIPTNQDVNWTHFGGVPPADEISILRGQLILMNNHLLYERHKREQHAKRNRRLLRKIAHTNMLEVDNKSMKDQLAQQEAMIRDQTVSIRLLQGDNVRLRAISETNIEQSNTKLRECLQENEDLKTAKMEINMLLIRQREEQESLQQKLQALQAKLFNTEKELENEQKHATVNVKLKSEVIEQQKELLLLGEVQQRTIEKMSVYKHGKAYKYEMENVISGQKVKIEDLQSEVAIKTKELSRCHQQLSETRQALGVREQALLDLRHQLEMAKASHEEELMSHDEKYQAMLRINQNLETHVISLYSEIEQLKASQRPRAKASPPSASASSTPDTQTDVSNFYGNVPSAGAQHQQPRSPSHDPGCQATTADPDSHVHSSDNTAEQLKDNASKSSKDVVDENTKDAPDRSAESSSGNDESCTSGRSHNTFTDSGMG